MIEEQRPLEGQDDQARDQDPQQIPEQPSADLTAPVDLNSTLPLVAQPPVSYPPPSGAPLADEPSPASGGPLGHEPSPPATGGPLAHEPSPATGGPFLSYPPPTGGPFVHLPPAPVGPPSASGLLVSDHPSEPSGLRGLGPGAISAIVAGALAIAIVAATLGGVTGAYLVGR
ncbi:MAG TPA: hypothetical protein VN712_04730, partial [Dermatophilaceae bacterium]|nr:hypothetical protein [Dermatophilaceae bacterium]